MERFSPTLIALMLICFGEFWRGRWIDPRRSLVLFDGELAETPERPLEDTARVLSRSPSGNLPAAGSVLATVDLSLYVRQLT